MIEHPPRGVLRGKRYSNAGDKCQIIEGTGRVRKCCSNINEAPKSVPPKLCLTVGKLHEIGSTRISSHGGHNNKKMECVNRFVAVFAKMALVPTTFPYSHLLSLNCRVISLDVFYNSTYVFGIFIYNNN